MRLSGFLNGMNMFMMLSLAGCGGNGLSAEFREAGMYAYQISAGAAPANQPQPTIRYTDKEKLDAIVRARAAARTDADGYAADVLHKHHLAMTLATANPKWYMRDSDPADDPKYDEETARHYQQARKDRPRIEGWFRVTEICGLEAALQFDDRYAKTETGAVVHPQFGNLTVRRNDGQCETEFEKMQDSASRGQ